MGYFAELHPKFHPLYGLGAFPAAYASQGQAALQQYASDLQNIVSSLNYLMQSVNPSAVTQSATFSSNLQNTTAWINQLAGRDDLSSLPGTDEIKTSHEQAVSAATDARDVIVDWALGHAPGGTGGLFSTVVSRDQAQGFVGATSSLAARMQARARESDFTAPVPVADLTPAEQAQIATGEGQYQVKVAEDLKNATADMCSPLRIFTGETTPSDYFANCAPPWMKYVAIGVVGLVAYKVFKIGKRVAR